MHMRECVQNRDARDSTNARYSYVSGLVSFVVMLANASRSYKRVGKKTDTVIRICSLAYGVPASISVDRIR